MHNPVATIYQALLLTDNDLFGVWLLLPSSNVFINGIKAAILLCIYQGVKVFLCIGLIVIHISKLKLQFSLIKYRDVQFAFENWNEFIGILFGGRIVTFIKANT
jgi:hypothetical protein